MKIKLKELRKGKEWSLIETAEILEISISYVKKLETGERNPGLKLAQKIAKTFGCGSIDEILQAS